MRNNRLSIPPSSPEYAAAKTDYEKQPKLCPHCYRPLTFRAYLRGSRFDTQLCAIAFWRHKRTRPFRLPQLLTHA